MQFRYADFAVIRHHVPELKDLTVEDLRKAVERNKDKVAASSYKAPHLENVLSYIQSQEENDDDKIWANEYCSHSVAEDTYMSNGLGDYDMDEVDEVQPIGKDEADSIKLTNELRLSFIDMVRASFERQVEKGELDARQEDGALYFALLQSCDFAADLVVRGHGLQGFEATAVAEVAWIDKRSTNAVREEPQHPTELYALMCIVLLLSSKLIVMHKKNFIKNSLKGKFMMKISPRGQSLFYLKARSR